MEVTGISEKTPDSDMELTKDTDYAKEEEEVKNRKTKNNCVSSPTKITSPEQKLEVKRGQVKEQTQVEDVQMKDVTGKKSCEELPLKALDLISNISSKEKETICNPEEVILNDDGSENHQRSRFCCNLECESQELLQNAPPFVLTYYRTKYTKAKSQKVCKSCYERAVNHQEYLAYLLMEHKPLLEAKFPLRNDISLIDDSDDEASDDEEPPLGEDLLMDIDSKLTEVIAASIDKYNLDFQIKESESILKKTFQHLEDECLETDAVFNDLQKQVDEMRNFIYKGFNSKTQELPPEDNLSVLESPTSEGKSSGFSYFSPLRRSPSGSPLQESPRRSSLVGVATKKVTQVRTLFPGLPQVDLQQPFSQMQQGSACQTQQEVVALERVKQVQPKLPPVAQLVRPRPSVNDVVYVMKHGYYGQWARAKILEVIFVPEVSSGGKQDVIYKIKFESRKSSFVKTVTGKQIAYSNPSPVRLEVGMRVIALFRDESTKESFYAGIIAEPPKAVNKYRYLVFFDDGYAQYVTHDKILVVCESSRNVWEDIHPESRDFVKGYLEQYPERPMLKLQQAQIVKTEWNGKWWIARVLEVDGSLVKMHFDADGRTELIYRGSTRLGPLYSELHNADARKKLGSFGRHRGMGISSLKRRNMPYVEYTRYDNEDTKNEDPEGSLSEYRTLEKSLPSRAVAKKSTSKRTESYREQLEVLIRSSDKDLRTGQVESIQINSLHKPRKFIPHQCGEHCIEGIKYDHSLIKKYNPLVIPQLYGWQRHITKCRGRKVVIYRTPCGRRLRSMEELHLYLRVSKSLLSVDLFDFDSWVHCFSEFVSGPGFINIKDLSYGVENVPVPCINTRDHSEPEYVKYSTVRIPMEGVNVNTDPNFLVGCDCTDDCQDKSKCACWQLTIGGTAFTPGGKLDPFVGYYFKRLREPVMTGIYECNSRCKCASTCLNRVAQHPLQLRLQVFKTENRGWGIRCLNDVPHGTFICIYAGRLLTEQGANEGGKNYGDEYLAELDYIEVVERIKEGYESDVEEDDSTMDSAKGVKVGKDSCLSEEEEDGEASQDAHDSDFEVDRKVLHLGESTIRTRLRNRKTRSSSDSQGKEREMGIPESFSLEKDIKKMEIEKKAPFDDTSSSITLSDDDDDVHCKREPSRFAAVSGPKQEGEKKSSYKSVREYYGDDEFCYIMDAKNNGNIGRYLNHSCTPNVFVQNVFVDTHDLRFPWVAFFALTYISAGTELTWDYNYDVGSVPGKVLHCYCGSSDCRGRLL